MEICQACKKKKAILHLTDIHNNKKTVLHLCDSCATEKGFDFQTTANLPQLLGIMAKKKVVRPLPADGDVACGKCGIKWSDFRSRGRLGCPSDYDAFRSKLETMIFGTLANEMHGYQIRHVGKTPVSASDSSGICKRICFLEKNLKTAISKERYEEAAKLRDEIGVLYSSLPGAEGGIDDSA